MVVQLYGGLQVVARSLAQMSASTSPPVHQSNEKPHVNGREGAFLQKTPINLSNVPSPTKMPYYATTEAKFQFDTMIEQIATRCKRPAR